MTSQGEDARPDRVNRRVLGAPNLIGSLGAVLLLYLSVTPSLLPRSWLKQGALSGLWMAVGYGTFLALWSGLAPERAQRFISRVRLRPSLIAAVVIGLGLVVSAGAGWDAELREIIHMPPAETWEPVTGFGFGLAVAALLVLVARMLRVGTRSTVRALARFVPPRTAVIASVSITSLLVFGLIQGVLMDGTVSAVSSTYSLLDTETSSWTTAPSSPLQSGSPDSAVSWASLGRMGRDFVGDGARPTVDELAAFAGASAVEPIRVYVGLRSAPSLEARVQLAVDELERTGGFERSVVAVVITTGTGWVDPAAVESLEFMYDGDTAIAALQYSYLPSWISFLVDRPMAAEAASALVDAVSTRVDALESPPRFLVFGESLGSFGAAAAFDDLADALKRTDGVLLVGPLKADTLRSQLTDDRDIGTPMWRPVVGGGKAVRFSGAPDDLRSATLYSDGTDSLGLVYLQNGSDPVPRFTFAMGLRKPLWLEEPPPPDGSPAMRWMPFVTLTQVIADLAFAMDVPPGHGHNYTTGIVNAWAALAPPTGWTDADTAHLVDVVTTRFSVWETLKAGSTP